MTNEKPENALDVLACDIELRPAGAPGLHAFARAIRGVERGERAITVSFDPSAAGEVEAFAEAERQCCADLSWTVERGEGAVRLTVGATPGQLDVLEAMFKA